MRGPRGWLALGAVLGASLPASTTVANTTTANLVAGGLIFARTDKIEMRSEDLFVSEAEIRVRYVFRNISPDDVTSLVAFPMPDIVFQHHTWVEIPEPESENFLDFRTVVDGQAVKTDLDRRVLSANIDRTRLLQDLGIPLMPFSKAANEALNALPADKRDLLITLGLVTPNVTIQGKPSIMPSDWMLKTTYSWTQAFPAGKDVVIEHRYRPSVGTDNMQIITTSPPDRWQRAAKTELTHKYCVDRQFLDVAEKSHGQYDEIFLSYILETGANWARPIGDFTLTIDKGAAGSFLGTCERDLRQVGPTTFRVNRKNYLPKGNLEIVIMKRSP